ncbi:FAD-binding molybdopterin dehydrogenase [Actinoplanes cyaneus]|uniref:FAD-binding molybdopterin dehydrogenase n=1 Tax=Actinoplanes cyaneus TaxID=52696 RepID=A0A919IIC1_9ACTN|nr:FAD binding domain-containing protein [Actinoplanes cyaneus]MCW2137817.1 CO or xanthine dehydrogenase, FAD-binding subunit [Actinoplanes cyaneus]GID64976.1 FAD-binding molybdopterin dehydrogenase [Actinoplanes cyaneus]
MDLHTVTEVVSPAAPGMWRPGDAWLGGGTALFGEPRPSISRLLDLPSAGWPPITVRDDGLEIAATCTVATLFRTLGTYDVVAQCCHAFLASFKIWNVATVGGNLCAALPAGPMISLGAALGGMCRLLDPSGGERFVPVAGFVTGEGRTVLREGELLRSIELPAVIPRTAFRRGSLHRHGRSAVLLIGALDRDGAFTLTVTAATRRPWVLRFDEVPSPEGLDAALRAIGPSDYVDDVHGHPAWRAHLTGYYAEQIRTELSR